MTGRSAVIFTTGQGLSIYRAQERTDPVRSYGIHNFSGNNMKLVVYLCFTAWKRRLKSIISAKLICVGFLYILLTLLLLRGIMDFVADIKTKEKYIYL